MNNKSFTLIELLVVIVIIGILAGVIIVSTSSSITKASIAKIKVFSDNIKNDLMLNLVSEWNFDEKSGTTTKDTWSSNFTGSLVGFDVNITANYGDTHAYGWMGESNCISGTCLKFSTAQYINGITNYPAIGSNSFTWEFWGKTGDANPGTVINLAVSGITNWQGAFNYPHGTTNKVLLYVTSSCYRYSSKTIVDDNWHHIIGVFNRNNIAGPDIYIDGILNNGSASFSECSTIGSIPSGNLYLANNNLANNNFVGGLDQIKMYNTALSSSEIKEQYIAGLNSLLVNGNISKEEYDQRLNNLAYEN